MYDLFNEHPELMLHSSLSAMNFTDKQDPSLVCDITRLYENFKHHVYEACGVYFKALHYFNEAFLDKNMDPHDRANKIWCAKTFFVEWDEQKNDSTEFISLQTFYDIICSCDGQVLYLETLSFHDFLSQQ